MDKRGGKSSNPLELPSGKSRKDDARRPGNKARTKDGGTSEVLPRNLLRASGPEPVAGSTATAPQDPTLAATGSSNSVSSVSSTRASTTVASSGRGTQASLADYPQTAPTVSTLTELGSARQPRLDKSNVGEGQKKKARLDLNEYKYRQNLSLSSAQNMSSPLPSYPSPVRKTPWSGTGISSPSPPPTRRAGTPLLDEGPRDDLHQYQQYQGLLPGIPQGSSFQPGPFLETPRGSDQRYAGMQPQASDMYMGHANINAHMQPDLMSVFSRVLTKLDSLTAPAPMPSQNTVHNLMQPVTTPHPVADHSQMAVPGPSFTQTMSSSSIKHEISSSNDESAGEETFETWSGTKLLQRVPTVTLSEEGIEAYKALKGVDENGIALALSRKVSRKVKDIDFYSKGARVFTPPEKNLELPKLVGFREKEEKKLVAKDKALGAIAACFVAAVDAARECSDDLTAAKQDFERDMHEDVKSEAIETCASSAACLNQRMIAHLIRGLKIVAVESALTTLERRALCESEVPHEDMRKILADSPTDEGYLYGGAVRDSVQKARDASMLSKAFTRYGNVREKQWERTSAYRPKNQRFSFKGKKKYTPRSFAKKDEKGHKKGGFKGNSFKKD